MGEKQDSPAGIEPDRTSQSTTVHDGDAITSAPENRDQIFDSEKQDGDGPSQNQGPPPPPNGGYGWVCTACVAIINAHTWGLNSSYGVFLAHYLTNNTFPGATHLEYAFIGGLSISCALLISPLATILTREIGTKMTLLLGIVLESASLICASFAYKIWHLFLTQGVLFGLGMGFLFVPSVGIVPQWFTTRRALANGFATAGSGLGGLLYSLATGAMIKSIGLEWAFRVLGILVFAVNIVCTLLIKDRNKIIGSRQSAFDIHLFKRPEYILLLGYGFFSMLAYIVLIFSLANYANFIGLDASQAAVISAIFNLGQGFGRPFIGYFSDRTGRINMACLTTFMAGVFVLAIWVNSNSYGVLILFSIVGGAVGGTFWATIGPVTAEVVGLVDVPTALNLIWLVIVLPCLFSEPIALQIVAGTGKYIGAQVFVGLMYIAAAICLFVLRGWKIGELAEIGRITNHDPEEIARVRTHASEAVSIKSKKVGRKRMLAECYKPATV